VELNKELVTAEPVVLKVHADESIPLFLGLQNKMSLYPVGCMSSYQASDYSTFGWLSSALNTTFPPNNYSVGLYWYSDQMMAGDWSMYRLDGTMPGYVTIIKTKYNSTMGNQNNSFVVHDASKVTLTLGESVDVNITTAFSSSTMLKYRITQKQNGMITYRGENQSFTYDSTQPYKIIKVNVPSTGLSTNNNMTYTYLTFMAYNCMGNTVLFWNSMPFNVSESSSSSSSSSSGLGADAIAGIVIVSVLIVGIVLVWLRTRPKDQDQNYHRQVDEDK